MPVHPMDIDAVLLPPHLADGLRKLIARTLGLSADAAEAAMTALFGNDAPAFGQVRRLSERDLKAACGRIGLDAAVPLTGTRELAELLPLIAPELPSCPDCGEFPLSDTGGKISTLPAGAACPFCKGVLAIRPMKLKKIAWTDGRLVEPQTSHDLRVRPGERIPLDDEGIVPWAGGWMHLRLERSLKDAGLPVYGLLAYMQLRRRALDTLEDAVILLQKPEKFGLADAKSLEEAIAEASEFLAEREPTNLPAARFGFLRGTDAAALPRLEVGGRSYVVEGLIGRGDASDVYRAAWDHPLTERVVIKVGRGDDAGASLAREVTNLAQLARNKANGTPFFVRQFPQHVASGSCRLDGAVRPATVFRYKNMFDWTLEDVIREYPDGVEPQTMVWMWNRTLALLGWLQMAGWTHGAIVPGHMLIHPVNHGMTLLGWTHAVRTGRPVVMPEPGHRAFHPGEVLGNADSTPETDVAMSARCMIAVLGGNPADGSLPASVPAPIADILRLHARYGDGSGRIVDAFALETEFGKVAKAVYGPRKYHPFRMPRRSR
ncbi:MAG TPA: hypothetical protein VL500_05250 [Candidatus Eisenbacteria bacterium]|nr:hypothetical protein [Candidatus Eisenbacteria bacterium]